MLRILVFTSLVLPIQSVAKQAVLNWRYKRRPLVPVPDVAPTVARALKQRSSCVPDGGVALSITNNHHVHLRPQQFALVLHQPCFMQRVVTVCYSAHDSYGHCVNSTYKVPPSDFRRSHYASLIWAKWLVLANALSVASIAMWLDADVLVLRNPWTSLAMMGAGAEAYDFRHQSEDPCAETECAGLRARCSNVNGGQLLLRTASLAQHIYDARPLNLTNYHRLDQDYVERIIQNRSSGYSSCALPATFASHCWNLDMRKGRDKSLPIPKRVPFVPLCQRTTHHFNCVTERKKKTKMMLSMIDTWINECGSNETQVTAAVFEDRRRRDHKQRAAGTLFAGGSRTRWAHAQDMRRRLQPRSGRSSGIGK